MRRVPNQSLSRAKKFPSRSIKLARMKILIARFRRPSGDVIESRYQMPEGAPLAEALTPAVAKLRAEHPGVRMLGIKGRRIEFSIESDECQSALSCPETGNATEQPNSTTLRLNRKAPSKGGKREPVSMVDDGGSRL